MLSRNKKQVESSRETRAGARTGGPKSVPKLDQRAVAFATELKRQRDRLYGIALFFDALELWYAGQAGVIETYRKQFRNVIRNGNAVIGSAEELLANVQRGTAGGDELAEFVFDLGRGYPDSEGLLRRADAIVSSYEALFPGRERSRPFSASERMELIEAAAACP